MKMRNTLSAFLLAAGTAAVGGMAQADVYVYDTTVTPPALVRVIPSNGYGEAYTQGHYVWDGTRYIWRNDRVANLNDALTYDRWSFVPDNFVDRPLAFEQPKEHGG